MSLRPGNEGATGELGAIVGADRAWIATEARRLIEQAHYVSPADAVIHGNVHALASEIVDYGQHLMRRVLASASNTKSMLQVPFGMENASSFCRSPTGRLALRRLRTFRSASSYRR